MKGETLKIGQIVYLIQTQHAQGRPYHAGTRPTTEDRLTYQIIRIEDNEYCPLLVCEKCKSHTRHGKGERVRWTQTDTKKGDLISTKFTHSSGIEGESVTYRTAWECGDCGTERVWGV